MSIEKIELEFRALICPDAETLSDGVRLGALVRTGHALLDELSRLREALKPFAAAAEKFDAAAAHFGAPLQLDTYVPHTDFTYGELRAAARALSEREGQE